MALSSKSCAAEVIARCRELARISDVPGETTRLFLSEATKGAHALLLSWMRRAGLETRTDDAGNLRGLRRAAVVDAHTLVLFSHIDTIPNAGAFDGPLGVMTGLSVIEQLQRESLPFHIELIAFSEEEGVRFGFPFLASKATVDELTEELLLKQDSDGISVAAALRGFGLQPERIAESCALLPRTFAAVEVHIEQGPVLEAENASIAAVESIIGQTRLLLTFDGKANHAGTTPMPLREDALAAAAQWIVDVEHFALDHQQLVATVGGLEVQPNASNVVPGRVTATLDVRHPSDESRHAAVAMLLNKAQASAEARGVRVHAATSMQQRTVAMDRLLTDALADAAHSAGLQPKRMFSGAGHDAMVLAPHVPTAMLFVRSAGGISHNPAEDVREQDVEAALITLLALIRAISVNMTR